MTPPPVAAVAKRAQTLLDAGQHGRALPDLRRLAIALPATAGVLSLLAGVETLLGRIEAAGRRYRWLFVAAPRDLDALRAALALPPEAGIPPDRVRSLLVVEPDSARGYAVLGVGPDGRFAGARIWAALLSPVEPAYLALAGARHQALGRAARAVALARRALVLDPATVDGHLVLAEHERSLARPDTAMGHARRALAIRRDVPQAWVTAAICEHRRARFAEADTALAAAAALRPRDAGLAARRATLLPHIVMSGDEMHRIRARIRDLTESTGFEPIRDPVRDVGTVPFALAYHGINDRDLLMRLCAFYRRVCPSLSMTAPHIGRARRPGRQRVAFVSEFFRSHSVFNMTEGHLRLLDRRDIEVTVVQIGPLGDATRPQLEASVDRLIEVPAELETVRETLAALDLDVLIFADIGMTAMSYFLAFARLAPLQIVLPGHPVTTGIDTVDVFFTSAWMEPANYADHYSETAHRVDGLAIAYADARVRHEPVSRAAVGLPADGALYLCGQMPFKIHPDFDRILGDILERDPRGTVVLFEAPGDFRGMSAPLTDRLTRANADRPDVMRRLRVLPRLPLERYIGLMTAADVVLDTFHFSGGNTTMQSLALARPLVAFPTAMMRGRVAAAPLHAIGLEADLLATSPEDFVDRAISIATETDRAKNLHGKLSAKAHKLIDSDAAAQSLCKLILTGKATR